MSSALRTERRGLIWRRVLRDNQSRGLAQPQPGGIVRRAQGRGRFLMTKRPPETTLHQNPRSQSLRSQKTTDLRQEAQNFLHDCDRSARYHTHRRTFFDWCHRWMMVAVLVSGSSAVAILSGAFGSEVRGGGVMLSIIIMLIPTAVGAISVVWNLTDRARDHEISRATILPDSEINQCRGSRPRKNRELAHRNSWSIPR